MTTFAPKGERPEWRMIYEDAGLETAATGDVIRYERLDEILGRPFLDNRGPLYRARSYLASQRARWLEVIPMVGYRVIAPAEHVRVSAGYKRRATRSIGSAVTVIESTDIAALSAAELSAWDAQRKMTGFLFAVARQHESRLTRIEEILQREGMM